ncbi:2Fe-2S iron-sulfur cluster-binding protein [Haloarculaceae archaeon H-GB2-1]|nr:2Fe-2S iron-sulfur cluster-binding protein [Haloarculaceae archaeon H-GB1-1]MEA5387179.1 2Fe-2S iron-sulfur cluster-binding protein [Haloarculaceae archaeon H-GB11]MEA5408672.1 2Fe-2S iron-sulfur cluster-binding protein [Haloarculaceae archaeon H-GB2-1]
MTFELADGNTATVDVEDGESILDAADDAGLDLRSGCRQGQCTSCTGKLVSGEVEYIEEPKAVTEDKREDGWVSLCIATPDGDCTVAKSDEVLVEAFPRVWQDLDVAGDD